MEGRARARPRVDGGSHSPDPPRDRRGPTSAAAQQRRSREARAHSQGSSELARLRSGTDGGPMPLAEPSGLGSPSLACPLPAAVSSSSGPLGPSGHDGGGPTPAPRNFVHLQLGDATTVWLDAVLMKWANLAAPLADTGSRITIVATGSLAHLPPFRGDYHGSCLLRGCICLTRASAGASLSSLPSTSPSATTGLLPPRRIATCLGLPAGKARWAKRRNQFEGGLSTVCSRLGRAATTRSTAPEFEGALRRLGRLSAAVRARPRRVTWAVISLGISGSTAAAAPGSRGPRPPSPCSMPPFVALWMTTLIAWPRRLGSVSPLRRRLRRRASPPCAPELPPGPTLPRPCSRIAMPPLQSTTLPPTRRPATPTTGLQALSPARGVS